MGKKKKRKPATKKNKNTQTNPTIRTEQLVQEQPKRTSKKKQRRLPTNRKEPNWILAGLAAGGMILTGYLVITGWLEEAPLFCTDGSSCDIVQQSRWGTFLMLPTALWGFLTYTALFYIGFKVRNIILHWKSAWTISLIGLAYSIYLTTISLVVIEATCAYCIASLIIMSIIFVVVSYQRPENIPKVNAVAFVKQGFIIAAVIVGVLHLHYNGIFDPKAGPEDPYLKGLAKHLTEINATFYGAYW